jgi:hypothetical protein
MAAEKKTAYYEWHLWIHSSWWLAFLNDDKRRPDMKMHPRIF